LDARDQFSLGQTVQAISLLAEANQRLSTNLDESLLLHDLLLSLQRL